MQSLVILLVFHDLELILLRFDNKLVVCYLMDQRALPFGKVFLLMDLDVGVIADVEYFSRLLHWRRLHF